MLHDMERAGIEIVHMLTESRPISGIISFQRPEETAQSEGTCSILDRHSVDRQILQRAHEAQPDEGI